MFCAIHDEIFSSHFSLLICNEFCHSAAIFIVFSPVFCSFRIIWNHVKMNKTLAYSRVIHDERLQIIAFVYSWLISYKFCHCTMISTAVHNVLQVGKWVGKLEPWKPTYSESPENSLSCQRCTRWRCHLTVEQSKQQVDRAILEFHMQKKR